MNDFDIPVVNDELNDFDIPVVNDESNFNDIDVSIPIDIYDPRTWEALSSRMIDVLEIKGPNRDLSIKKGPNDKVGRQFSSSYYTRTLSNGEKCDRDWLVYSKEIDMVFCFCCKLFHKEVRKGKIVNEGFGDWSHLGTRIREHEISAEHLKNMSTWYELRIRFNQGQTIDKTTQKHLKNEKEHWKNVLVRIVSVVKFLSKYNLAFRGSNSKLYQSSNGNFLGCIEMLAEFYPVVQEHVKNIKNDELHSHYLGHNIQNELIILLTSKIKCEIIKKIKVANYFSVVLDCTSDCSREEQMTLILRYVDVSSNNVVLEESFLSFLNVNDKTGKGLFDVLLKELEVLDIDLDNIRDQGYDNGSNMKGNHQGVQKRLLDKNPKEFYTTCGCHSLNLALCDMANTCGKARDFFGVVQRIYTIFSNSTKRWAILKDNVKGLTLKSFSATRWESRIDSVRAIIFQMKYRETGFSDALAIAKEIAVEMNVDSVFPQRREIRRKKHFDESVNEASLLSSQETFGIKYFIFVVDQAIISLNKRFEQYYEYESIFGFLFTSDKLHSLEDKSLKDNCINLHNALTNDGQTDIDGDDLYAELKLVRELLPEGNMRAFEILNFFKKLDYLPNAMIAYIILLTIHVTVASAEQSFSKLKLLKSYMCSSMSQERLNGLALITIKNNILEEIKYEELIDDFASRNARRISVFK